MIIPDFYKWAIQVTGLHCVYRLVGTQEALQQAFDQGRALGYREGFNEGHFTGYSEWYTEQDGDRQWLDSHDQPTED